MYPCLKWVPEGRRKPDGLKETWHKAKVKRLRTVALIDRLDQAAEMARD